jgi:hypothetical protein
VQLQLTARSHADNLSTDYSFGIARIRRLSQIQAIIRTEAGNLPAETDALIAPGGRARQNDGCCRWERLVLATDEEFAWRKINPQEEKGRENGASCPKFESSRENRRTVYVDLRSGECEVCFWGVRIKVQSASYETRSKCTHNSPPPSMKKDNMSTRRDRHHAERGSANIQVNVSGYCYIGSRTDRAIC